MSDDTDCEIEYLEEDEEIVNQCVQTQIPGNEIQDSQPTNNTELKELNDIEEKETPLLVERKVVKKQEPRSTNKVSSKRKRKTDSDSDYDPTEDLSVLREDTEEEIKKTTKYTPRSIAKLPQFPTSKIVKKIPKPVPCDVKSRKDFNIRIPDYDDPLCMPVRAIQRDEHETRKLRNWNNMCLEHLKHSDKVLKPESGATVSSKRTFVLRNIKNKFTGRVDTTIWGKTAAENKDGERKSEVFQCILPKYRENKLVNYYQLSTGKSKGTFSHVCEVILTKEVQRDGEILVTYRPNEAVAAVYKLDNIDKSTAGHGEAPGHGEARQLRETCRCRQCAACYQAAWRGVPGSDTKCIRCQICSKTFVSVHNLLSHLRAHHPHRDVRRHRRFISRALCSVMKYHYKCRICQTEFLSIKQLRRHVKTHSGTQPFHCEVGNHTAT